MDSSVANKQHAGILGGIKNWIYLHFHLPWQAMEVPKSTFIYYDSYLTMYRQEMREENTQQDNWKKWSICEWNFARIKHNHTPSVPGVARCLAASDKVFWLFVAKSLKLHEAKCTNLHMLTQIAILSWGELLQLTYIFLTMYIFIY